MTSVDDRRSRVQTYYGRRGRLRTGRREALDRLLPVYGVEVAGAPLDPAEVFGRRAPLVLEIGSGMGVATARMAAADPVRDYLAAEVHAPGVANLLQHVEARGLTNVRVAHGDALDLLEQRIAPSSLAAVHVFFPDPWPKARHHKRRLFQPGHVALIGSRLAAGGVLHAATDQEDYATVILETLRADPDLVNRYESWAPRQPHRSQTRYERKAVEAGRRIYEVVFHRR